MPERMQNRQIKTLAFQKQSLDQGSSIEFAIDGEVDRNPSCPAKGCKGCEVSADRFAV